MRHDITDCGYTARVAVVKPFVPSLHTLERGGVDLVGSAADGWQPDRAQSALDAIQILGGNGYINEYPTGRLLRDAKLYEIGAGTSEVRRMLIGRELFNATK